MAKGILSPTQRRRIAREVANDVANDVAVIVAGNGLCFM